MLLRNLDVGTLRAFLLIADGHSFAETAERVGRSPSAISLQIQRLEADLGTQILRRNNRGVALTLAGEQLLGLARRIVRSNDDVVAAFRTSPVPPRPVRFGTTQDFAEVVLPELLRRFAREHPAAELTLRVDLSGKLIDAVHAGELDLAIATRREDPLAQDTLVELPMLWIGREAGVAQPAETVPLALFEAPCSFRSAAVEALAAGGRPYRVAFSSPSLPGLRSAVLAGIGVTVRTRHLVGQGLADVGRLHQLPPLPNVAYALYAADRSDVPREQADLAELCRRTLREA